MWYLLSQDLPHSAILTFNSCISVQQWWKQNSDKYQAKSQYTQNILKQVFLDMHFPYVHTFLTSVHNKCKKLAAVGVTITNWNYQRMVLKGISEKLAKFTAQLLTSVHINHPPAMDTNTLHQCHLWGIWLPEELPWQQHTKLERRRKEEEWQWWSACCHQAWVLLQCGSECPDPDQSQVSFGQGSVRLGLFAVRVTQPSITNDSVGDGFWIVIELKDQAQFVGADSDLWLGEGEEI